MPTHGHWDVKGGGPKGAMDIRNCPEGSNSADPGMSDWLMEVVQTPQCNTEQRFWKTRLLLLCIVNMMKNRNSRSMGSMSWPKPLKWRLWEWKLGLHEFIVRAIYLVRPKPKLLCIPGGQYLSTLRQTSDEWFSAYLQSGSVTVAINICSSRSSL